MWNALLPQSEQKYLSLHVCRLHEVIKIEHKKIRYIHFTISLRIFLNSFFINQLLCAHVKDYYQMICSFHQFIYKGKSNSGITDIKLSHFKRGKKKVLWAKQGNRSLFPLLACGESFSMVLFLHIFFSPSQNIKPNSIVRGLRENRFLFRGFLLYILSGNRYVKNNSRIHTIPANELASAFTGLWFTESFRQMNSLEGFSCNICNAHPSTK